MKKLKLIVICVPLYPLYLIGEWYETSDNGRKFSFKKFNSVYWREIADYLRKDVTRND